MIKLLMFYFFINFLYANSIKVSPQWQLLGTSNDINLSIFNNSCVDIIWTYKDDKWFLFSPNKKYDYSYKMKSLKKGEGFWIKGYDECNITISKEKRTVKINEPYYKYMWHINPNSIYNQKGEVLKGADVNITKAWEKTYGEEVTVAIIDDCFNINHPDLYSNIMNTYNVNTNSTDVSGQKCHGTEVTGVVGAVKNTQGIIGVAPKVKLILISINFEKSTDSQFVEAFEYAKNQGANIINCSWGSYNISQILHDELKSIHDKNIKIIFASGNDNANLDENGINDESEDPNVIGVGATGENNDVTYYSSYGSNLDILAPGGSDIGILSTKESNKYDYVLGTSFAAPIVSGAVALKLSLNPNLTFEQIRDSLIKTADKIGIENGAYYINGFDKYRAYGKINIGSFVND